jgi:predicted acyltransferase
MHKIIRLAAWGTALTVVGQLLHLAEPINKQLWTTSYVVLTGGLALLVLAISIWLLDVKGWRGWARPAVVFGSNALIVFVGSGVLARLLYLIKVSVDGDKTISLKHYIYSRLLVPWAGEMNGSLVFALLFILFWLGILWVLYRKRIFIKV